MAGKESNKVGCGCIINTLILIGGLVTVPPYLIDQWSAPQVNPSAPRRVLTATPSEQNNPVYCEPITTDLWPELRRIADQHQASLDKLSYLLVYSSNPPTAYRGKNTAVADRMNNGGVFAQPQSTPLVACIADELPSVEQTSLTGPIQVIDVSP